MLTSNCLHMIGEFYGVRFEWLLRGINWDFEMYGGFYDWISLVMWVLLIIVWEL
jgi:hypothetical protein